MHVVIHGHSPGDSKKKRLTTIAHPVYELFDEPSNLTMCIVISTTKIILKYILLIRIVDSDSTVIQQR